MLNLESQLRTDTSLTETSSLSLDFKTWLLCIQNRVFMQECYHFRSICALFGMSSQIICLLMQYLDFLVTNSAMTLGGICSRKPREVSVRTLHILWEQKCWRFINYLLYPTYPFQRGWSETGICNHFFHRLSWILHQEWAPLLGHEDDGGGQLGRNTAATAGWSTAGLGHPVFLNEIFIWWFFSNRWRFNSIAKIL